jgi:uncharacterized membrane protein
VTMMEPPAFTGSPPGAAGLPPAMSRLISRTLRVGVVTSAALALVGLCLLLGGPASGFSADVVHGTPFTGTAFLSGLLHGQAVDVLFLAFIVLIATPLLRVIISVALFAQIGDRPFTTLTVTVLVLLGLSILIGAVA